MRFVLDVELENIQSCRECPAYHTTIRDSAYCNAESKRLKSINHENARIRYGQRPSWCPLKKVEVEGEK